VLAVNAKMIMPAIKTQKSPIRNFMVKLGRLV